MAGKKILLSWLLSLTLIGLTARGVAASYVYENGEDYHLIILDKQVKPSGWVSWHDNLSTDKYVFVASDKVDYKLKVKNTSDHALKKIEVTDRLPDDIVFLSASDSYTQNGQEIKWEIEILDPDHEVEFFIQGQLKNSGELLNRADFCTTNWAKARAESGHEDEDTAQICVETPEGQVLGAKELPEAGVNLALGSILGMITAAFGALLKRKK